MSWITWSTWIGGTLVSLLGVFWLASQAKLAFVFVETEIEIDASAGDVWSVLIDFPRYREWNPNLVEVNGRAERAAPLDFRAVVAGTERALDARIDVVAPGRELTWTGPISSLPRILFWGEHRFAIEEVTPGRVRFRNDERFGGVLALPLAGYLRGPVAIAYGAANAALERRVNGLTSMRIPAARSD